MDSMTEQDRIVATEEGYFVSEKWMFLAEMLQDYNPGLELRWIPPDKRTEEDRDKPYMVVHKDRQGKEYIVLYASELDSPEEVMARIFNADMAKGDVLKRMEARNKARELFRLRALEERLAEEEDFAAWLLKTTKSNPTFRDKRTGELVKLDSQLNRVQHRKHYS